MNSVVVGGLSLVIVFATVVTVGRATAQEIQAVPTGQASMERLASASYPRRDGVGTLILLSRALPVAGMTDALLGKTRPNGVGNAAYLLVDASYVEPLRGRILFVSYITREPGNPANKEVWAAQVAWDREQEQAIVAIVRRAGSTVDVSLYVVKREYSLRDFPIEFRLEEAPAWPQASPPLATIRQVVVADHDCGLAGIDLVADGPRIVVGLRPGSAECGVLAMEYRMGNQAWSISGQEPKSWTKWN